MMIANLVNMFDLFRYLFSHLVRSLCPVLYLGDKKTVRLLGEKHLCHSPREREEIGGLVVTYVTPRRVSTDPHVPSESFPSF